MSSMPLGGNKRLKGADANGPAGNASSGGNFHQAPPYSHPFQQPPFGQQQYPMQPPHQPGYNMWQHSQQQPPPYGSQPPPPFGQQPAMFRQPTPGAPPQNGPPMTPDRSGPNWNGYRGPPQQQAQGRRPNGGPNNAQRGKGAAGAGTTPSNAPPIGAHQQPPPTGAHTQQYQQWGQPQQPWAAQAQWAGAPPHVWQQGHPGIPPQPSPPNAPTIPQHMYPGGPQGATQWTGANSNVLTSPARPSSRLRSSPENAFPLQPGVPNGIASPEALLCKPVGSDRGMADGPFAESRDEDGKSKASSEGKGGARDDKGRGSYRCGRCGVPKKGHICPYQPKLKRRPDEPPPETRNASIQVEMDEFMTLRRLNIQIQGFPESYATGPHMSDDMVVGEPHVTPPVGMAPIASGLMARPGLVGSDATKSDSGAITTSLVPLSKNMQSHQKPMEAREGDKSKEKTGSVAMST